MTSRRNIARPLLHNQRLVNRMASGSAHRTPGALELALIAAIALQSVWIAHCWLGACTAA